MFISCELPVGRVIPERGVKWENDSFLDLCVCFFPNLNIFHPHFCVRNAIFHSQVGEMSATPVAVENLAFSDLIPSFAKF